MLVLSEAAYYIDRPIRHVENIASSLLTGFRTKPRIVSCLREFNAQSEEGESYFSIPSSQSRYWGKSRRIRRTGIEKLVAIGKLASRHEIKPRDAF